VVGDVAAIATAGWMGACALLYWRIFGPLPLGARDIPRMTPDDFAIRYEELEVRTEDGLRLLAWLLPGARNAVIVVSGGYRGDISDVLGIASALNRSGFSVVAYGWRGTKGSDPSPHTLGALEQRDLRAVLDAVERRLGALPIGLLGYSMGGAISISVAAADPRVHAVCTDSAFADPVDLLMERAGRRVPMPAAVMIPVMTVMAGRTGARLHDFRPIDEVGGIAPRPLLLIHGDADRAVPVEHARRLLGAARQPAELWVLPGVGHVGAYFADRAGYVERVTGFFDSSLPP
jgi:dipeptidyl aminopeptidase/acylaminoacyl peptidase